MQKLDCRHSWLPAIFACVFFFVALPHSADAATDSINGVYLGTIGGQTVVMELRQLSHEQRVKGTYFYRQHGIAIDLVGSLQPDGSVRLSEQKQHLAGPDEAAEWQLTFEGDTAKGVFCKCDLGQWPGVSRPVVKINLKRLSHDLVPAARWEEYKPHSGNIFFDLLLDFPVTKGAETKIAPGIGYTMQTDPRFHVSLPQLTHFPDASVTTRINQDLEADFIHSRLWASACLAAGELTGTFGGSYDETAAVVVFPPEIFSVVIKRSWYCGAAHGDSSVYSLNYRLRTGERFDLDNAFQAANGSSAIPDLTALFLKLYLSHYAKPPDVYTGSYVRPSGEEAPIDCQKIVRENMSAEDGRFPATLYLSAEGLVIRPVLPYVLKSCGADITIPYRELRPFVKANSILHSVVESRSADALTTN